MKAGLRLKSLFITEKPSVAREFANALDLKPSSRDGYLESEKAVITCVWVISLPCHIRISMIPV